MADLSIYSGSQGTTTCQQLSTPRYYRTMTAGGHGSIVAGSGEPAVMVRYFSPPDKLIVPQFLHKDNFFDQNSFKNNEFLGRILIEHRRRSGSA